jgi:alginate O-acetyltransferase complex protein AlgI
MNFVSTTFLAFFAIVFTGYWLLRAHRARMVWLLAASAVFYMSWNPWLIGLIAFSASVDYLAALGMERWPRPRARRTLLAGSVTINLGLLIYFKYVNFFAASAHAFGNWVGLDFQQPVFQVVLPLGISFYTFETISYVVDVYRGKARAERNLLDYFLFILFFPHLIAGPIVRPSHFLPQTRRAKRWSWPRVEVGVRLFLLGLLKKAVLADRLAEIVDPVFADPSAYGTFENWLAALAYPAQIYGDFSGYSDMAIGLAHLFGFRLHANFNLPYIATSLGEFWRRWHISLSSWLRDYLYIPLGGSRGGRFSACRNLMITMTISGLWHGASWNMVLWGAYHGALLALAHLIFGKGGQPILPRPIAIVKTYLIVMIGFVLFRAASLSGALAVLQQMTWPAAGLSLPATSVGVAVACLLATALGHFFGSRGWDASWDRRLSPSLVGAALALAAALTVMFIPESGKGFIYFQF